MKTIEWMERHCCIHQILINNGWIENPQIDENTDGLPFYIDKSETEDLLFKSFFNLKRMKLSNDDWNCIKREWGLLMENCQLTFIGDMEQCKNVMTDVALWAYGLPILVIFDSSNRTFRPDLEFFHIELSMRGGKNVRDITPQDISDAFWEKYQSRFEENNWRQRELHFRWVEVGDDVLQSCSCHRDNPDYGLERLGNLLRLDEGEDFYQGRSYEFEEGDEDFEQLKLLTTPIELRLIHHLDDFSDEEDDDEEDDDEEDDD